MAPASPASDPAGASPSAGNNSEAAAATRAEDLATELSHDLMSPYCPGRTIATCPSPQARKLENIILEQAKAGKTRVEIESELAKRFPDIRGYVGRPEIIYGTAVVALLAIIGLFLAARRWVGRSRAGAVATAGAVPAAAAAASPSAEGPPAVAGAGNPSRREIDALDDALDRIDEF
jgi:cytochrome c-type biogenesis protein CcmH/NrfF